MKTPRRRSPVTQQDLASMRRWLASRDRVLFRDGRPRADASLNDQFYHLWERILMKLAESIGRPDRDTQLARLEVLADELIRAQEDGQLPEALVEELVPRYPHAAIRQA